MTRALCQAVRDDEIVPLYEGEAELTGSHVRLVDVLMEAKTVGGYEGMRSERDRNRERFFDGNRFGTA